MSQLVIICCPFPKVNRRILSILLIVTAVGACQQAERPTTPDWGQPVDNSQYFLYDGSCRQQSLQEVRLPAADDASLLQLKTDADSLQTSLIAKTIYGETYRRQCHIYDDSGKGSCLDRDLAVAPWVKVADSGKELRLCPSDSDYPEDSFEYIAVTSAYYLHRAQQFFVRSVGRQLPQMNLLIMPFFQTIYEQDGLLRDNFLYHNIIYFPASRDLAVLPEPRDYHGPSLWDSSFVLAHEFAHHLQFAEIRHHREIALATLGHSSYRRGLEAFLEGWADLFAYYSEGESSQTIVDYPCLGSDRDVGRAYFSDGIAKVVDRQILANYLSPSSLLPSACGTTDFNSSHMIGAVFAHHMHVVVSYLLENTSTIVADSERVADKYRYLHRWLSRAVVDRKKSDQLFAELLTNIYRQVSATIDSLVEGEQRLQLQSEICHLFEQGFPQISGCRDG